MTNTFIYIDAELVHNSSGPYYISTDYLQKPEGLDDMTTAQREVIALLDAASNEQGFAVIEGLGERFVDSDGVTYWIDQRVK